jgi:hypothetical protein
MLWLITSPSNQPLIHTLLAYWRKLLCERPSIYSRPISPVPRPYKRPSQERASQPLLRVVPFLSHHSNNLLSRGKASLSLGPTSENAVYANLGAFAFHALG